MTSPPTNPYRMLLFALVGGFIVLSVAEVWLLTVVGTTVGVGWTLAILLVEAVVGALLLRGRPPGGRWSLPTRPAGYRPANWLMPPWSWLAESC